MQDITGPAFMALISRFGAPDFFVTEYLRVHATSGIDAPIAACLEKGAFPRPVVVQLLGEDTVHLARSARELQRRGAAGIDLNLGCPAPKVFRKKVGGGLLRDLDKIKEILRVLRGEIGGFFSVKTRVGFADTAQFDALLDCFAGAGLSALTVHGRTVRESYRGHVRYDLIARAQARMGTVPVFANGDLSSATKTLEICAQTGCAGAMLGRAAVRNPWIFGQIAALRAGKPAFAATRGDVRAYVRALWETQTDPRAPDAPRVGRLKKFLNFVGQSVDADGAFLRAMRRAQTPGELAAVCDLFLGGDRAKIPVAQEPYPGVVARPNCEAAASAPRKA